MINITTFKRLASLTAVAVALVLVSGNLMEANAQRDPFAKPSFMKPRKAGIPSTAIRPGKAPGVPVNYGPPAVEARIEYYKRLRNAAVANGEVPPKVTTVLTLNELMVTGIFKTPRGYAAIVEATPIKLSYSIYPGEKIFDGQLVAVEENRLVFRKVTKVGEGKFISSVENKPLREYSTKSQLEGTAVANQTPQQPTAPPETAANNPTAAPGAIGKPQANPFLSPVDEMDRQPQPSVDTGKERGAKSAKKPAKAAKKNN